MDPLNIISNNSVVAVPSLFLGSFGYLIYWISRSFMKKGYAYSKQESDKMYADTGEVNNLRQETKAISATVSHIQRDFQSYCEVDKLWKQNADIKSNDIKMQIKDISRTLQSHLLKER